MTVEQKAYITQLEASGYLKQLREFAVARWGAIALELQGLREGDLKIRNGSITYVSTGQRELGISNDHV